MSHLCLRRRSPKCVRGTERPAAETCTSRGRNPRWSRNRCTLLEGLLLHLFFFCEKDHHTQTTATQEPELACLVTLRSVGRPRLTPSPSAPNPHTPPSARPAQTRPAQAPRPVPPPFLPSFRCLPPILPPSSPILPFFLPSWKSRTRFP